MADKTAKVTRKVETEITFTEADVKEALMLYAVQLELMPHAVITGGSSKVRMTEGYDSFVTFSSLKLSWTEMEET